MRLDKVSIDGFKNLRGLELDFDERQLTTVLIGQNGAGKSNLIEAITLVFRWVDLRRNEPRFRYRVPDAAVPDVVFCYRDPASGASRLVRMHEIPDVPELLVLGPLGLLMTSGALERFVKTHKGSEARKQKAKAWLESLRASKPGVEG